MNRFRRPLTRREKTSENDGALLHFSCGLIVWNKALLRQPLNILFSAVKRPQGDRWTVSAFKACCLRVHVKCGLWHQYDGGAMTDSWRVSVLLTYRPGPFFSIPILFFS
ncbi:hypothetical protein ETR_08231 [Erwinia tracheiphila PSU-1]|nr:hypothetical protein ETR_08231 [Erwinia tracheiphila PSU-1]